MGVYLCGDAAVGCLKDRCGADAPHQRRNEHCPGCGAGCLEADEVPPVVHQPVAQSLMVMEGKEGEGVSSCTETPEEGEGRGGGGGASRCVSRGFGQPYLPSGKEQHGIGGADPQQSAQPFVTVVPIRCWGSISQEESQDAGY